MKRMLKSDVVVLDTLDCDQEELDFILKSFNAVEFSKPITLIVVSSLMCWARTPCEEDVVQQQVEAVVEEEELKSSSAEEEDDEEGGTVERKKKPVAVAKPKVVRLLKPNFVRPRKFMEADYQKRVPNVR